MFCRLHSEHKLILQNKVLQNKFISHGVPKYLDFHLCCISCMWNMLKYILVVINVMESRCASQIWNIYIFRNINKLSIRIETRSGNFSGMPICAASSHVHPISGSSQVYLSRQWRKEFSSLPNVRQSLKSKRWAEYQWRSTAHSIDCWGLYT